jgi:hypothetical protein
MQLSGAAVGPLTAESAARQRERERERDERKRD